MAGRPRIYANDAEKARAYRARKAEREYRARIEQQRERNARLAKLEQRFEAEVKALGIEQRSLLWRALRAEWRALRLSYQRLGMERFKQ